MLDERRRNWRKRLRRVVVGWLAYRPTSGRRGAYNVWFTMWRRESVGLLMAGVRGVGSEGMGGEGRGNRSGNMIWGSRSTCCAALCRLEWTKGGGIFVEPVRPCCAGGAPCWPAACQSDTKRCIVRCYSECSACNMNGSSIATVQLPASVLFS